LRERAIAPVAEAVGSEGPAPDRPRRPRTAKAVFDDHLRSARVGDTEGDISRNYAPDVVLLTGLGILRGHAGVRRSREVLAQDLPDGRYRYVTRLVDGDHAFLEWVGDAEAVAIDDGADGFTITDGLIRVQTIHYTIRHRNGYHEEVRLHRRGTGS
jgi:hypothetical protein